MLSASPIRAQLIPLSRRAATWRLTARSTFSWAIWALTISASRSSSDRPSQAFRPGERRSTRPPYRLSGPPVRALADVVSAPADQPGTIGYGDDRSVGSSRDHRGEMLGASGLA